MQHFNSLVTTILEKNKKTKTIRKNSDVGRKRRSKNVKILELKKITSKKNKNLQDGDVLYKFKVESAEKIQGKVHRGYVILDKNENVKDLYCSCNDWKYKWRKAFELIGIAKEEVLQKEYQDDFNGAVADIRNPKNKKHLCKHLQAVFDELKI